MKGFKNNYSELQLILNECTPQIVSIQETHCPLNSHLIVPKNFSPYFTNNPQNQTAKQGVGILIKNNIPHKQIHIQSNIQVVAIEISLNIKFTLISLYIPPCLNFDIHDLLNIFRNTTGRLIVLGDFNSWNTLWGSPVNNRRGNIVENALTQSDLCILNDGRPTHFSTHGTFSHIDLSCCSPSLFPIISWNISDDLYNSDHYPILLTLNLTRNNNNKEKIIPKFVLKHANWNQFSEIVDKELKSTPASISCNKEAAIIKKSIRKAANIAIPQTTCHTNFKVPWWNKYLGHLRRQKMKAWHTFRRSPTQENLVTYKKQNAIFRKEMRKQKIESFREFTAQINPDTPIGELWNKVNRLSNRTTTKRIIAINSNNGIITDSNEIANYFVSEWAAYSSHQNFSPQYNTLHSNIDSITVSSTQNFSALQIEDHILFPEFDSCLKRLKGTTPGSDRISYQMIKALSFTSKSRLLSLYNNILDTSIIPHDWKTATLIPIPKNNTDKNTIKGYRPISLISCLSKVLERIVANRIIWFTEKNHLIAKNQVAFKPKRGCADALLFIDYYTTTTLSRQNHATILSIDFERAFDRVGSHIILSRLKNWGIGPKIFNFVKSFLKNRQIKTRINHTYSDICRLENGIPQGSPLSVILFTIAFNDISEIIHRNSYVEHVLYADDLYILCNQTDNDLTIRNLRITLQKILDWTETSGAKISFEKTKSFHICKKRKCNFKEKDLRINN